MSDLEIAIKVDEYVSTNLKDIPFDKGLPLLRKYIWSIGDSIGKDGTEIMKIYFEWKSKNK